MGNNNKQIEQDGCGNGSLCRHLQVRLKHGKYPNLKRVDNWKVLAVTVSAVDYLLCEHWDTSGESPKTFKVYPQQITVQIKAPNVTLRKIKIIQFGINNNRATIGHKLQGMSKSCLFAVDYDYRSQNWIYVILSRVRDMKGYCSYNKLDISKLKNQIWHY